MNRMSWYLFIAYLSLFQVGFKADPNDELWNQFKKKYNKIYADQNEENKRKLFFADNFAWIMKTNFMMEQSNESYRANITYFADFGNDEYKQLFNKKHPCSPKDDPSPKRREASSTQFWKKVKPPIVVDWRKRNGLVSTVKNQFQGQGKPCNSGYAFAAVGGIEGQLGFRTNRTFDLSAQQLIDCSYPFGNLGCKTGSVDNSFEYSIQNGIHTESDYPYLGKDQKCHLWPEKRVTKLDKYVTGQDEEWLEMTVGYLGPVAATMDPSSKYFQFYHRGIITDHHQLDCYRHDLLVVGYGINRGTKYWIVKNSFGLDWGTEGYVFIQKGVKQYGIGEFFYLPALERPK